jgi:hypothetical protein
MLSRIYVRGSRQLTLNAIYIFLKVGGKRKNYCSNNRALYKSSCASNGTQ